MARKQSFKLKFKDRVQRLWYKYCLLNNSVEENIIQNFYPYHALIKWMIISHKNKFIFIKTRKTAGTSIEVYLSKFCGEEDILTPLNPKVEGHEPINYQGAFSPLPELRFLLQHYNDKARTVSLHDIKHRFFINNKYYGHIPAIIVKSRIPKKIWNSYYKFCVERNPWDKTISHYYWFKKSKRRKNDSYSFNQYMSEKKFCLNYPMYTDYNGETLVDFVIKYESLYSDLANVFDKLGIPFEGSLNVREKANRREDRRRYSEFFSGENSKYIDVISKVFEKEILMHGYKYEKKT